jgi:hypothetical protein
MATKPTVRIPVWSSTGTKTDPGAGKEASGWSIAERPPAYWFNWILNAVGQWLGYFNNVIDEFVWTGRIDLDVSPAIIWQRGIVTNTDLVPQGDELDVVFSNNVVSATTNGAIFITGNSSGAGGVTWQATFQSLTTVRLKATLHDGTAVNIASAGQTASIYMMIVGA